MKLSIEKKIAINFGAALAVLLLIAAGAAWNAHRFAATFASVDHTHQVLGDIWEIQAGIYQMQSGARGFVLTGDDHLLMPYFQSQKAIAAAVVELRTLVRDNPAQSPRLAELQTALADSIAVMESRILSRRTRGLEATRDSATLLRGQGAVNRVRTILDAMDAEEDRLMTERVNLTRRAAFGTIASAGIGGALAVALIVVAGLVVIRDYRAREVAEQALRVAEESTRQMVDSIRDYAIIRVDPLGRVSAWTRGAQNLLGYSADEIVGQHIARFYPEDAARQGFPQQELRVASEHGRYEDEGWRVRRDGTRFWANVVLSTIRDARGELVGFVKITRDLSARRAAEEEIRTLNQNLQGQNERLELANRELESFSYSVSHDLRAPLRHIDGFSALLTKHAAGTLDERGQRYLTVIADSARRMGRLIDDLLTFSRMGRAQMECIELDHHQLVMGVIRDGGFDRDHRIEWHIAPLPPVRGDAAMLRQVWLNLIDNAVKYSSRAQPPRIEIGGGPHPPEHEQLFFIRDNGVGFDMKYAGKLFGVFQRLHSDAEFEGTGIGLANVRRIVTRHHGRIWAESSVGAGATFSFTLPDQPAPSAAAQSGSPPSLS